MSRRGTAAVVMSVFVVVAMVAAAAFSRQSADLHRRAQVVVEQLRGDAQELSALRWRVNTQLLLGNADLAPVVTEGVGLVTKMNAELTELGKLQPGGDTQRLKADVDQFYAIGSQQLSALRKVTAAKKESEFVEWDSRKPVPAGPGSYGQRRPARRTTSAVGSCGRDHALGYRVDRVDVARTGSACRAGPAGWAPTPPRDAGR